MSSPLRTLVALILASSLVSAQSSPVLQIQQIQSIGQADRQGIADTSSECSQNPASLPLWESHVCSALKNNVMEACLPQKRVPDALFAPTRHTRQTWSGVQGLVLYLHGYSACADAAQHVMKQFQEEGYVTLSPLMVGHGRKPNVSCDAPNAICVDGYQVTDLPQSGKGYQQYADWVASLMTDELSRIPLNKRSKDFKVTVIGLSIGAVIGQLVAGMQNKKLKIDNLLLLNGVFGASDPTLDLKVVDALNNSNDTLAYQQVHELVEGITGIHPHYPTNDTLSRPSVWKAAFEYLVKKPFESTLLSVFTDFFYHRYHTVMNAYRHVLSYTKVARPFQFQDFYWDKSCNDEVKAGRGGFCAMKNIHLIASHEVGLVAVSRVEQVPSHTRVKYIATRTDGIVRPKISFDMASKLKAKRAKQKSVADVSMCIFGSLPNCNFPSGNNTCAMPHSCFSRAENLVKPPFKLYWEDSLLQQVRFFVHGLDLPSDVHSTGADPRTVCTPLELDGHWESHREYLGYRQHP